MKTNIFFILIITLFLFGCKKSDFKDLPSKHLNAIELKKIYESHKKENNYLRNSASFQINSIDFESASYYEENRFYAIPVKMNIEKEYVKIKVFMLLKEVEGNEYEIEFLFLRFNSSVSEAETISIFNESPSLFYPENLAIIQNERIDVSVIKYNEAFEKTYSCLIKNNIIEKKNYDFNIKTEFNENRRCTGYFWVLYMTNSNGEEIILSETLIYVECDDTTVQTTLEQPEDQGGGGTANESQCNYTREEAEEIINNSEGNSFSSFSTSLGETELNENGSERQFGTKNWQFYSWHWVGGQWTRYTAYFSWVRTRENRNSVWKWEAFDENGWGISEGGDSEYCMSLSMNANISTPRISNDRSTAYVTIHYHLVASVTCLFGITAETFDGSHNNVAFRADNP